MTNGSFWSRAGCDPDRIAVISERGVMTYGQLATLANQLSNGLRSWGLRSGETVALLMSNRPEFLAIQLATHQAGLRLAPLNCHLTGTEAGYILADSGARLLIGDEAAGTAVGPAADQAGLPADSRFCAGRVPGFRPLDSLLGAAAAPHERTAGGLLLYSSGTTGRPKGIERPLSGMGPDAELDLLASSALSLGMTPGGVFLSLAPLYHSAPNQHTFSALQLGQTIVLGAGFDPARALDLIQRHSVTDTFLVPTMMHRLLTIPPDVRGSYDVSSLRFVLHAGAMCPVATKQKMIAWLGPVLVEYYGASESGKVTLISSQQWLARPGSVGRAEPGCDVQVCDEQGRRLAPNVPGLLHLKGPRTFIYRGDPDKTASSHQSGYFIPGDIGYLDDDGWVYLCDRRTDLIISGGVNIYPAEIEAELLQHEAVADAVVIGVPDDEWGQRVVALVELRDGRAGTAGLTEELLRQCRERLAGFKVPRVLTVVPGLPRMATGKLNRGRVRADYLRQGEG
jgi:acyl-CoA synthetase (AMP-forming)/AMP-acid ligase II